MPKLFMYSYILYLYILSLVCPAFSLSACYPCRPRFSPNLPFTSLHGVSRHALFFSITCPTCFFPDDCFFTLPSTLIYFLFLFWAFLPICVIPIVQKRLDHQLLPTSHPT
ncbi:hypothetical protein DFS34DRAFT_617319 [Phlyctochytrium arcticum]|nr:hypothetical protein DFS34DRAFT_617319 [Phlyctochytrium arcticum]